MDVIKWLESPAGERWSRAFHAAPIGGTALVSIKDDSPDLWYVVGYVWYIP